MVHVVFNAAGSDEREKKVQASIATLVKKKVASSVRCNCTSSHLVVTIAGAWKIGDFEVKEMTACCMDSLAAASEAMAQPDKKTFFPAISKSALGQAAFAADGSRGRFSLR